jgi:hypothetical protein
MVVCGVSGRLFYYYQLRQYDSFTFIALMMRQVFILNYYYQWQLFLLICALLQLISSLLMCVQSSRNLDNEGQ